MLGLLDGRVGIDGRKWCGSKSGRWTRWGSEDWRDFRLGMRLVAWWREGGRRKVRKGVQARPKESRAATTERPGREGCHRFPCIVLQSSVEVCLCGEGISDSLFSVFPLKQR